MTEFLNQQAGPWTMHQVVVACLFVVAGFIARIILNVVISRQMTRLAARTESRADDLAVAAIVNPLGALLPIGGIFLGTRFLLAFHTEWGWMTNIDRIFRVVSILLVIWTAFRLVDALTTLLSEVSARTGSRLDDQLVPLVRKGMKIFLGALAFVLVAQNLGYSVSGLLAGLGIGGLALAMASKDTLANLFGSLMILIDRPFRVGDYITFDGGEGVVEEIGMRSTRVRTRAKTVVSIPNQALANSSVENHTLMPSRRIRFTLGVTYDAKADQMQQLVDRITAYLNGNPDFDNELTLVKFNEFGSSSLDVLVQCFTVETDWPRHMQIRQDMNLQVMGIVEQLGLSIAFPTRTVHMVTEAAAEA